MVATLSGSRGVKLRMLYRRAFVALVALLAVINLITGIAQAQHAPIIFYNVPNWTPDYLSVRYLTPLDAFFGALELKSTFMQ